MSGEQYDPVANPYAPGAGTPPPTLVGRDQIIEAAEISLRRLIAKVHHDFGTAILVDCHSMPSVGVSREEPRRPDLVPGPGGSQFPV